MNTAMTCSIESTSSAHTERLAGQLGQELRGGEIIELASDLGGGKTTFVRGLAHGMGSPDKVSSPTFTIQKIYKATKLELHHYDFYRLAEAGLTGHELEDSLGDKAIVTVVEWADVVSSVLPEKRLTIRFVRTGEESRTLELRYPRSLSYLIEGLC